MSRIDISTLKVDRKIQETFNLFSESLFEISKHRQNIIDAERRAETMLDSIDDRIITQKKNNIELQDMIKTLNNEEF